MRKTRVKAIRERLTITQWEVVKGKPVLQRIPPTPAALRRAKRAHVRHES